MTMIKQPKNPIYNTILTGSLSELDDEDDDTGIKNDIDLPLKTNLINHPTNFPDLMLNDQLLNSENNNNEGGDAHIQDNATITNDKRVRFETEGSDDEDSDNTNSKRGIEDLLQNANEVNNFIGDNLEKLNTFNSDSNSRRNSLYRILSDVGTTRTESLSNFDLSENELDTVNSHSFDNIEANIDSILNNENLNISSDGNIYNSNESLNDSGHATDASTHNLNDGNDNKTNYQLSNMSLFDFSEPTCRKAIQDYLLLKEQHLSCGSQEDTDFAINLLYDPDTIKTDNVDIPVEDAISNFEETIHLLSELSHREDMIGGQIVNPNRFHTFSMKNVPSLSYHDLLQRIQSKCMFGSIIYQTATYLFQILLLSRTNNNERMKCTHTLHHEEIHRIIIATVRIGAKLTEDFVHSHQYFCKVCGISKKLLSRLEASLLICLKQNRLMITCERIAASVAILEELRTYQTST
ncbi:PHO85 cyclin-8 [Monosporozyma unispora]